MQTQPTPGVAARICALSLCDFRPNKWQQEEAESTEVLKAGVSGYGRL